MNLRFWKKVEAKGDSPLKKQLPSIILIDSLLLALGVYLLLSGTQTMVAIMPIFAALAFTYMRINHALGYKKREEIALEKEFVNVFGYLEVYLRNGVPVYSAFKRLGDYSSPLMKEKLEELIADIDKDKSVEPYVKFAGYFSSLTIKEVMISLYLLVEQGENDQYLRQFSTLFSSFSSEEKKMAREKRASSLNNIQFFPLIGSALTMIMITIGIMNAIGGIIGGQ